MIPRLLFWLSAVAFTFPTFVASSRVESAAITFGSGANQFNMEFVEIGSPGNVADTTGDPNLAGAVPYIYNMGKYEVSRDMITKANSEGNLAITMFDMSGIGGNGVNRPATGVFWNEAARFVNWLNISQGFAPAYKFALQPGEGGYDANQNIELWTAADTLDFDASNPFRSKRTNYVLPSMDEWYKAAYYDPASSTYYDYPNGLDEIPDPVTNGTLANTAVYDQPSQFQGPADIMDAGGLSPFGIMGLGGNVQELQETEYDLMNDNVSSLRSSRGGYWSDGSFELYSLGRDVAVPTGEGGGTYGFRVVSLVVVPEPSSLTLGALFAVCGLSCIRRRLRK